MSEGWWIRNSAEGDRAHSLVEEIGMKVNAAEKELNSISGSEFIEMGVVGSKE